MGRSSSDVFTVHDGKVCQLFLYWEKRVGFRVRSSRIIGHCHRVDLLLGVDSLFWSGVYARIHEQNGVAARAICHLSRAITPLVAKCNRFVMARVAKTLHR